MKKNSFNKVKKIALLVSPLMFMGGEVAYANKDEVVLQQKTVKEILKVLQKLAHHEIDESFLLIHTIDNLKDASLKEKLLPIKRDCDSNIDKLEALIKKYGGEAPTYAKDFKGYFMQGYSAVRGVATDKGTLKALHTNLKIINNAYKKALETDLPFDVRETARQIHESKEADIKDIESIS